MSVDQLSLDSYQQQAEQHAWFLEEKDPQKRLATVQYGLNEEIDELLHNEDHPQELTSLLWGHPVDEPTRAQLSHQSIGEIGDNLYYITAGGMLIGSQLREIARKGAEFYTGEAQPHCTTFAQLDLLMADRMGEPLPTTHRPDYFTLQFFNLPPFHKDGQLLHVDEIYRDEKPGPLTITGDGRYALAQTLRPVSEWMGSSMEDYYTTAAGIALCAMSAVSQSRLGSSLTEAARRNLAKLERRAQAQTQQDGQDPERSRQPGVERERLSGWDVTMAGLICAAQPE